MDKEQKRKKETVVVRVESMPNVVCNPKKLRDGTKMELFSEKGGIMYKCLYIFIDNMSTNEEIIERVEKVEGFEGGIIYVTAFYDPWGENDIRRPKSEKLNAWIKV